MADRPAPDPRQVPVRDDGLQIDEDRAFQRRHWRRERLAWVGFAAIVAAALAGLSGAGGPLSGQQVDLGAATAQVPRVGRLQRPDTLVIRLPAAAPAAAGAGAAAAAAGPAGSARHEVRLDPAFLDLYTVDTILPAPLAQRAGADGLWLAVAGQGGKLRLSIRPRRAGLARFALAVDGTQARAAVLVLP